MPRERYLELQVALDRTRRTHGRITHEHPRSPVALATRLDPFEITHDNRRLVSIIETYIRIDFIRTRTCCATNVDRRFAKHGAQCIDSFRSHFDTRRCLMTTKSNQLTTT